MEKIGAAVTLVLIVVLVGLLSIPTQIRPFTGPVAPAPVRIGTYSLASHPTVASPSVPAPTTGYPRTVLVETFTGVWCHFCPAETQALYQIDRLSPAGAVAIPEMHVCAGSPCLENYVPPDQTSTTRGSFYGVTGFPTVFFDGQNAVVGGNSSWIWQAAQTMQKVYQRLIDNAASFPGNVSIAQHATVSSPGNVSDFANITSPMNGTFNAVTYLLENVDKLNVTNGYGPHDVGQVVRATLANHPVTLVAGTTTEFRSFGALNSAWNTKNLSVVTFVQNNSTKIVENTNMAPVTTLTAAVAANVSSVVSNATSTITLQVANSSTGAPISGASISLTSNGGGTLNPSSGVTAGDGTFSSTFTAPSVSAPKTVVITAQVTASGYTAGSATASLVVNPLILSDLATGLTVSPGDLRVPLNWTTPATGGVGVTYHVYRSTSATGLYTPVGVSTTTSFVDTGLVAGQSYWYKVSVQNSGGFSANTTPISATGVTATTQGLPSNIGWWLSIDSMNFSSATNASLPLYLPEGLFAYEFGPASYAFIATAPAGPLSVAGVSLSVAASFSPRYASLQGTVTPATASASVLVNGAPISVVSGAFAELLPAGTYYINVTATGYLANTSTVVLTPGNLSSVIVALDPVPGGPGLSSTSTGGLTGDETIAIIAAVVIIGVAAVVGAMILMSQKGKRNQRRPRDPRTEP
jgi:hypothetical protein